MRTSTGAPLAIHAGFHFGPVIDDNADVFGDAVNVAARLSSLAKAGQTLASAETVEALSPALRARTRDHDAHTVRGKQNDIRTFELIWQESEEELTALSTRPATRPVGLKLTHGARELDLDQNSPPITLGRDAQNDVVIMDRKASRLHARIERRRDKFVHRRREFQRHLLHGGRRARDHVAAGGTHPARQRAPELRPPVRGQHG